MGIVDFLDGWLCIPSRSAWFSPGSTSAFFLSFRERVEDGRESEGLFEWISSRVFSSLIRRQRSSRRLFGGFPSLVRIHAHRAVRLHRPSIRQGQHRSTGDSLQSNCSSRRPTGLWQNDVVPRPGAESLHLSEGRRRIPLRRIEQWWVKHLPRRGVSRRSDLLCGTGHETIEQVVDVNEMMPNGVIEGGIRAKIHRSEIKTNEALTRSVEVSNLSVELTRHGIDECDFRW